MFDFIEEPMPSQEKPKIAPVTPVLEGTIYTMPAHRESMSPGNTGKSGWLFLLISGVGIVVIATIAVVWWIAFRTPSASEIVTQTPVVEPSIETTIPPVVAFDETSPTTPASEEPTVVVTPPEDPSTPPLENSDSINYVKSIDSDNDDLTDTEERLFGTDFLKPDTDDDGYLDGAELKFLYDPLRGTLAKLETAASATLYTNPTYRYSLRYPAAWVVDSVDKANKEVIFSSATGEFMTMVVQDNPEKLSALEWYTTVYHPNTNTTSLQTMKYDTWTGVMTPDGLSVYITAKDDQEQVITPYVYAFSYDLGGKTEMNFGAVFQMMIRSFLITDLSFKP